MSGTAFVVGAELVVKDGFSLPLDRLLEKLLKAEEGVASLAERMDTLGLGAVVKRIDRQWDEISKINQSGVDRVLKSWGTLDADGIKAFGGLVRSADTAFGDVVTASTAARDDVLKQMEGISAGTIEALKGIGTAAPEMFAPIATSAAEASRAAIASVEGITGATRAAVAEMRGLGAVSAAGDVGGGGGGIRRPSSGGFGRSGHNSHGGLHMGQMGAHVGGAHVGVGGDGIMPAIGGVVLLEGLKQGVEAGFDFRHWVSQFEGNGFKAPQIDKATKAAWQNAGANPNASATESMKMILEANKMTGDLEESIHLLPTLSMSSVAMQSVKAEDLKSHFNDGTQIFNFAKYLEEVNATANVLDKTPEEHLARTQAYAKEAIRTMITSRGVTDGNSLYALSNNSKGSSTNWDMEMATAIAPIIGDVMRHSKMGNADYMELKSYQGGHITPDAVEGLMKYGLVKAGRDASQDKKGNWHLMPNSPFAEGMETNLWSWSAKKLAELKTNGYDITDQKVMNGFVNAVGSNGSTSNLMRVTMEPGPRALIQKELTQRDNVPEDAASILQNTDPVLKLDALGKKWHDLMTALGDPLVDPAIVALTKLTSGINSFAQMMHDHPDMTKIGGEAAGVAGVGLLGYGAGKMLGVFGGGGDAALSHAATELDASALALKEAAVALGGRYRDPVTGKFATAPEVPGTPATPVVPVAPPPGKEGFFGGGGIGGFFGFSATALVQKFLYDQGAAAMDHVLGWTPENQKNLDHATSLSNVIQDVKKDWFGQKAPEAFHIPSGYDREMRARMGGDGQDHSLDGVILGSNDAGKKLGELKDRAGFVLTSFDGLKGGGVALNDKFHTLAAGAGTFGTGLGGAAHELSVLALAARTVSTAFAGLLAGGAGGAGGGSGIINASWGGGGSGGSWGGNALAVGSGFGGGSWAQSGATKPEVAAYIRHAFGAQGIDPETALRVSQSEGFNQYTGDYGTSFGPFQLHYGGSGIRGMNSDGLGDRFTRETGLNARDPKTWKAQIDYAAKIARQEGWGAWHGAQHVGIGNRQGIGTYHGPAPTVDGRVSGKTSTPGAPAKGGAEHQDIEAAVHRALGAVKMEVAMNYDRNHQKAISRFVVAHAAKGMAFPNSMGGPNSSTGYVSPGTPVTDAA